MKLLQGLTAAGLVAALVWCGVLEWRLRRSEQDLQSLADVADDCVRLKESVEALEDASEDARREQRDWTEERLTELEVNFDEGIQDLRKQIRDPAAGDKPKGKLPGVAGQINDALKNIPELNEALLSQVVGVLSNQLSLDDQQSEKIQEILKRRLEKANELRAEVEAGKKDSEEATTEVYQILSEVIQEANPILNDAQRKTLERLVGNLGISTRGGP